MLAKIFETIFQPMATQEKVLIAFSVALLIGLILSFLNYFTLKNKLMMMRMSQTIVVLPLLVSVIIYLVGTNVASALSLGGAFAIIRFRSPAEPKDLSYVLASMGCGLACGLGFIGYGLLVALIFCIVMIVLRSIDFGEENYRLLKIKVPENFTNHKEFDKVIEKHVLYFRLQRFKTVDLGTVYEFHYVIREKESDDMKAFFDELRCLNGNLPIAMVDYAVTNFE